MQFVLATKNQKKLLEMQRILEGLGIMVKSLNDFPDCPDVIEDADSFEGNAIKKAIEVAKHTGLIAISDDSGLEVEALGGAPGVYSARYAGEKATDEQNCQKLLQALKGIPADKRQARFVSVIALADSKGVIKTFYGFVQGTIGFEPKGSNGFGYDPLFYPLGYDKTFAELTSAQKDSLSHRGMALRLLRDYLATEFKRIF